MQTTAPRITTSELFGADAMTEFLTRTYGCRVRLESDDGYRLRHRRIDVGSFSLNDAAQPATLDYQAEPVHQVVVLALTSARMRRVCDGVDRSYDAGSVFLSAYPGQPSKGRLQPGESTACVLDAAMLARVAATAPGLRPEPIRFTALEPRSAPVAAHWVATRAYVAKLLANPEIATAPLLLAGAAHQLAAATLAAFPNTALTEPTVADRHDASVATVRRAKAFIDANAAADISITDMAAAACVSVRATQLAFRRHLGTTPTAYLRRVRLDHAHQALVAADPSTTTVSSVAAHWGFVNHSRFTATYRHTYGVLPSATLHGR